MFNFTVEQNVKTSQKCEFAEYGTLKSFSVEAWSGNEAISKVKALHPELKNVSLVYVQK